MHELDELSKQYAKRLARDEIAKCGDDDMEIIGHKGLAEKRRRFCTLNSFVKWLTKPSFTSCTGDYLPWWLSVICDCGLYGFAVMGVFWTIMWLLYNFAT